MFLEPFLGVADAQETHSNIASVKTRLEIEQVESVLVDATYDCSSPMHVALDSLFETSIETVVCNAYPESPVEAVLHDWAQARRF